MILDFLAKNALALILFCGTLLISYGYYKAKIEDLIKQEKKVDEMAKKIVDIEKFQAVQETTNSHYTEQWKEIVDWMKNLESKLDKALQR